MAHFEIYILNYNGAHFLRPCLSALRKVERGSHSMTVNVVDNGSTDLSHAMCISEFPEANFIPLGFNHGFSKGNNLGVIARMNALAQEGQSADFHVLLNSDTEVEPNWLLGAAAEFADSSVGIVGSKAVFRDRFAIVQISSTSPFSPREFGIADERRLGVFMHAGYAGENIRTDPGRIKLPDAFPRLGYGYWLKPEAKLFVPILDASKPASFSFYLENHHPGKPEVSVILSGPQRAREVRIEHLKPLRLTLEFEPEEFREVVQNAGSFVTPDWNAGDRGFLEIDRGQYDVSCEVDAICGVSMFVRAELWEKLGGFDDRYFAYYEDTDLSLRARLLGYRCVYTPASKLLHVHAGSGVEHSDYFNRNVACSHLIFGSKFMNRAQWKAKRQSAKQSARLEFEFFKTENSLVGKPHLTAYCRYLKQFPYFLRNRLRRLVDRPERLFFGERPLGAVATPTRLRRSGDSSSLESQSMEPEQQLSGGGQV